MIKNDYTILFLYSKTWTKNKSFVMSIKVVYSRLLKELPMTENNH